MAAASAAAAAAHPQPPSFPRSPHVIESPTFGTSPPAPKQRALFITMARRPRSGNRISIRNPGRRKLKDGRRRGVKVADKFRTKDKQNKPQIEGHYAFCMRNNLTEDNANPWGNLEGDDKDKLEGECKFKGERGFYARVSKGHWQFVLNCSCTVCGMVEFPLA